MVAALEAHYMSYPRKGPGRIKLAATRCMHHAGTPVLEVLIVFSRHRAHAIAGTIPAPNECSCRHG